MRINRLFANVAGKALALATVMMTMCVVFTACSKDNEGPKSDAGKYVDLGLPSGLKWATCNLGATKPSLSAFIRNTTAFILAIDL